MKKIQNWYTSIPVIMIFFIIFFPIAYVLLYIRFAKTYGKYIAKNKLLFWVGALFDLLTFSVVSGLIEEFDVSNLFSNVIIIILPTIYINYIWYKGRIEIKSFDLINDYIYGKKIINIQDMSHKLNYEQSAALSIIKKMLKEEVIAGYLEDDNTLILNSEHVEVKTMVVKCKSCGASNSIVVGKKSECEYCGTLLQ